MTKFRVTDARGMEADVTGFDGMSLMETLRDAGYDDIQAVCGGSCSCATCHVIVDPSFAGALPRISADEEDLLDSLPGRAATSRLSCQIPVGPALDGMKVTVPPAI